MARWYGGRTYFESGKSLFKGKHRFELGQTVVSNWNYCGMPPGSMWKIFAICKSGSLKLEGRAGSYLPEKFLSIEQYEEKKEREMSSVSANTLYIAIEIGLDWGDDTMSVPEMIKAFQDSVVDVGPSAIDNILVASTKANLEHQIKQRIAKNSAEKWMIFYGHTVAEVQPNVIFRNV